MKLGSLKEGGRDGTLIVVSRDLSHALRADGIAPTLQRALEGKRAWITGLRREQSAARAEVPLIDTTEPRAKLNPLANWTWNDVWHYIKTYSVDYNPLHDEFYPSIGCAPCTRAIAVGEDFRAGRWWWEDEKAKECGLHVKDDKKEEAVS